jgi:hypothetical protein
MSVCPVVWLAGLLAVIVTSCVSGCVSGCVFGCVFGLVDGCVDGSDINVVSCGESEKLSVSTELILIDDRVGEGGKIITSVGADSGEVLPVSESTVAFSGPSPNILAN